MGAFPHSARSRGVTVPEFTPKPPTTQNHPTSGPTSEMFSVLGSGVLLELVAALAFREINHHRAEAPMDDWSARGGSGGGFRNGGIRAQRVHGAWQQTLRARPVRSHGAAVEPAAQEPTAPNPPTLTAPDTTGG